MQYMIGSDLDSLSDVQIASKAVKEKLYAYYGVDTNDLSDSALKKITELTEENRRLKQPPLSKKQIIRKILSEKGRYAKYKFGNKQGILLVKLASTDKPVAQEILIREKKYTKVSKRRSHKKQIGSLRGLVRDTRLKLKKYNLDKAIVIRSDRRGGYFLEIDDLSLFEIVK